jgi:hypothetical protein
MRPSIAFIALLLAFGVWGAANAAPRLNFVEMGARTAAP